MSATIMLHTMSIFHDYVFRKTFLFQHFNIYFSHKCFLTFDKILTFYNPIFNQQRFIYEIQFVYRALEVYSIIVKHLFIRLILIHELCKTRYIAMQYCNPLKQFT